METGLSTLRDQVPDAAEWDSLKRTASGLAQARGFVPNHFLTDPASAPWKILAALMYGRELGIGPMTALQGITVIDGKPSMSAQLIGALIRRAGHKITAESTEQGATVTITRTDGTEHRGTFTMADAQRAGLVRPNSGWTKYPKDMCYARAMTQAARHGAQDVLAGVVYTPEELGADEDAPAPPLPANLPPAPMIDAEGEIAPAAAAVESQEAATAAEVAPVPVAAPVATPAPRSGARSRSASPRRTNVVTVAPPEAVPVAAPSAGYFDAADGIEQDAAEAIVARPSLTPGQAFALTSLTEPEPEPVVGPHPLQPYRDRARTLAARLLRLRVVERNTKAAMNGQPADVVPGLEPSAASDNALQTYIESSLPGQRLDLLTAPTLESVVGALEGMVAQVEARGAK